MPALNDLSVRDAQKVDIPMGFPAHNGKSTSMKTKETAVTCYVLGLLTGMILAFASCSMDQPLNYEQQTPTSQHR